jgi:alkylation response protein AidB-like acyl-CoA dehydrogenase
MKQFIVVCKCWRLWIYGRYPLARLLRDSRLGPIGGGSEILKEILSKMIIDNTNYKPAVK